ncbi:LysM peptidoglycan-binding domain-containing protein [Akkermansiaceae bacterium]|nr:LysM peptidoglycan-binding domain-containing protein [Akkermansiaceae bacterium]
MRFPVRTLAPWLLAPLLTQCGTRTAPQTNAVTGPFDSRGNYIEEWVDQPDKWYRPAAPTQNPKPKPLFAKKETPPAQKPPEIAVVQPRPEVSQPKPKPKPVVVKPKPKPKPVVVKYTVKKGDNLSRIASRHGIGLSALRRANGISGDLIRPGQVLTIPR